MKNKGTHKPAEFQSIEKSQLSYFWKKAWSKERKRYLAFTTKFFQSMKLLSLSFLLLLMSGLACKSSQSVAETVGIAEDFQLILTRTGCKGRCPTYTMYVDQAGDVAYEGQMFVKNIGRFTKKLSESEVEEIAAAIEAADFWNKAEKYDDTNIMDLPSATLEVRKNGTTHKVMCRFDAPEEMNDLLTKIETVVGEDGFTEAKK